MEYATKNVLSLVSHEIFSHAKMIAVHNSIGSFSYFIRYSEFSPNPSRNIFFTLHKKDILKISYPSLCDQVSNRISDRVSGIREASDGAMYCNPFINSHALA